MPCSGMAMFSPDLLRPQLSAMLWVPSLHKNRLAVIVTMKLGFAGLMQSNLDELSQPSPHGTYGSVSNPVAKK